MPINKFAKYFFIVCLSLTFILMLLVFTADKVEYQKSTEEIVKEQFSSWDGSHKNLTKLIKLNMKNPSSYEHIDTRYSVHDSVVYIYTQFYGTNSFNAKIVNNVTGQATLNGTILNYQFN